MFEIPTSTISSMMASASGTLGSSGMVAFLAAILGIPFAFWVIERLINAVTGRDTTMERADRAMREHKEISDRMGNKDHFYLK